MSNKYTATKAAAYVGYFVQAIVNNFLPILFIALQDVYGIGYEKLGRLIMFNFATQMLTDVLTPKIVGYLGYRKSAFMCAARYTERLYRHSNIGYNLCVCKRAYGGYYKPYDRNAAH